ncbi:MAG: helix-turn-helix domain-containing protein [Hyphomicrobium sp.]
MSDTNTLVPGGPNLVPGGSDPHADCRTLTDVLARIGDKWTVMVVGVLSKGPMRYSQILKAIDGVSQRMLTLTLKGLERDGLVTRTVYPTNPPRVDYTLTERGHTLTVPLHGLWLWARANKSAIDEARRNFDQARPSGPLSALLQKLPRATNRSD